MQSIDICATEREYDTSKTVKMKEKCLNQANAL